MIQDMSDVKGKQSGVRMVTMRRGLLPDPHVEGAAPAPHANDAAGRRRSPSSSQKEGAGSMAAAQPRKDRSELVSLEEEGLLDGGSSEEEEEEEDDDDDDEGDDDVFDLTSMDAAVDGSGGRGAGHAQGMRSEMVRFVHSALATQICLWL